MGGESAGDKVERPIFKREMLGWGFYGLDVAQPLFARRQRDRRQHLGRQIARDAPPGMARESIGDMAPASAEIEGQVGVVRQRCDRLEVGPLTVNRALDIGFRSRAELRLVGSFMGLAQQSLLFVQGLLPFALHCSRLNLILLQGPPCLKRIRGDSSASSFAPTESVNGQGRRLAGGEPRVFGARNSRRSPASA